MSEFVGATRINCPVGADNLTAKCAIAWDVNTSTLSAKVSLLDCVGGPLWKGTLTLDLSDLSRQVRSALEKRVASQPNMRGWGWSDLKASALRITKRLGVRKLGEKIRAIANDPRFKEGLAVASVIYPPLGISYGMVRRAADTIDKASKGDQAALYQTAQVAVAAREALAKATAGDQLTPQERDQVLYARALTAIHAAKKEGHDVAGWAFNLPYRSPSEAWHLDRTDPGVWGRGMYARGIARRKELHGRKRA